MKEKKEDGKDREEDGGREGRKKKGQGKVFRSPWENNDDHYTNFLTLLYLSTSYYSNHFFLFPRTNILINSTFNKSLRNRGNVSFIRKSSYWDTLFQDEKGFDGDHVIWKVYADCSLNYISSRFI